MSGLVNCLDKLSCLQWLADGQDDLKFLPPLDSGTTAVELGKPPKSYHTGSRDQEEFPLMFFKIVFSLGLGGLQVISHILPRLPWRIVRPRESFFCPDYLLGLFYSDPHHNNWLFYNYYWIYSRNIPMRWRSIFPFYKGETEAQRVSGFPKVTWEDHKTILMDLGFALWWTLLFCSLSVRRCMGGSVAQSVS